MWLLDQHDTAGAIALLEQARGKGRADDVTESILSKARREGDAGS
jgi:hypothetical protein